MADTNTKTIPRLAWASSLERRPPLHSLPPRPSFVPSTLEKPHLSPPEDSSTTPSFDLSLAVSQSHTDYTVPPTVRKPNSRERTPPRSPEATLPPSPPQAEDVPEPRAPITRSRKPQPSGPFSLEDVMDILRALSRSSLEDELRCYVRTIATDLDLSPDQKRAFSFTGLADALENLPPPPQPEKKVRTYKGKPIDDSSCENSPQTSPCSRVTRSPPRLLHIPSMEEELGDEMDHQAKKAISLPIPRVTLHLKEKKIESPKEPKPKKHPAVKALVKFLKSHGLSTEREMEPLSDTSVKLKLPNSEPDAATLRRMIPPNQRVVSGDKLTLIFKEKELKDFFKKAKVVEEPEVTEEELE